MNYNENLLKYDIIFINIDVFYLVLLFLVFRVVIIFFWMMIYCIGNLEFRKRWVNLFVIKC